MKGLDTEIPDNGTSWEGYAKSRVEEHLKRRLNTLQEGLQGLDEKTGDVARTMEADEDGLYYLVGFATADDKRDWQSAIDNGEGRTPELELWAVPLPEGGGGESGGFIRQLVLGYNGSASTPLIATDGALAVDICYTVRELDRLQGTMSYLVEGGTLVVERRRSVNASWQRVGSVPITSAAAPGTYTSVPLTPYLTDGEQMLRLCVTDDYGAQTSWLTLSSVTMTTVALRLADDSWRVASQGGIIAPKYYIWGDTAKKLRISLDGGAPLEWNVGVATYSETPYSQPTLSAAPGRHSLEAWLVYNNGTQECSHVLNEVLVAGAGVTEAQVLVADGATRLTNWERSRLLRMSLWSPDGMDRKVTVALTGAGGETLVSLPYTLSHQQTPEEVWVDVAVGDDYFGQAAVKEATLSVTVAGASSASYSAEVNIDNSEGFAPTPGATFVLNPSKRTNTSTAERPAASILNDADGAEVGATFSGVTFTEADGWTSDDDGVKVLRVLQGDSVTIEVEPFAAMAASPDENDVTVELDVALRNVSDYDARAIFIGSESTTGGVTTMRGLEVRSTSMRMLTGQCRTEADQEVHFSEDKRTHLAVNVVRNIRQSGINLVRLVVNGVINREYKWPAGDSFGSGNIVIGSTGADVDIYGIRVTGQALSATQLQQDRLAALPTAEEKRAFKEANDITTDGAITLDKAMEAGYNCFVLDAGAGEIPSYHAGSTKSSKTAATMRLSMGSGTDITLPLLDWQGQGTSSMGYYDWNLQQKNARAALQAWLEAEASTRGITTEALLEALWEEKPALWYIVTATLLCLKINWASSPQSHKMGAVALYNDLHEALVGSVGDATQRGRTATIQVPVMVFIKEKGADAAEFRGLGTFGPGKGDAHTFGWDGSSPLMMVEGCDNGQPLARKRIPWDDAVTESGGTYYYGGEKQWERVMGTPTAAMEERYKEIHNWVYLHRSDIAYYGDSVTNLRAGVGNPDTSKLLWVADEREGITDGERKALLYRYDTATGEWVNAGVGRTELDLVAQTGLPYDSAKTATQMTQQWVQWRLTDFAAHEHEYYRAGAAEMHKNFCRLVAAKDNWAKNTYERLWWDAASGTWKVDFYQDDLDTIFATDNVGRQKAPYYVEEHDRDDEGAAYWNADDNTLWCLLEQAMPEQMRSGMYNMLTAMQELGGSVEGCLEEYFFSTQRYFPAVAYNETARIRYERAAADSSYMSAGSSTNPLAQSLGDQLECELQWAKLRVAYMSSYARYGAFAPAEGSQGMKFRSVATGGTTSNYTFAVTPAIWLYPVITSGQSAASYPGGSAVPVRVAAGQQVTINVANVGGNTNVIINGSDWLSAIDGFSGAALGEQLQVAGRRLREFVASSASANELFRPTAVDVSGAPNLRRLSLRNATTVSTLSGTGAVMEEIDLQGTGVTSFTAPGGGRFRRLLLGSVTQSLTIREAPLLEALQWQSAAALETLRVSGCPGVAARVETLVKEALTTEGGTSLKTLECHDIDWHMLVSVIDKLVAMAESAGATTLLTGTITAIATASNISELGTVSFATKVKMINRWGDVDSEGAALRFVYNVINLTQMAISGRSYMTETGTYRLTCRPDNVNANDITSFAWALSHEGNATIDERTGVLTVHTVGSEESAPTAIVTCTAQTLGGTQVQAQYQVGFYNRTARVGDYVYADGSYSDVYDAGKTVVGICYWVNADDPTQRLCVATKDVALTGKATWEWGILSDHFSSLTFADAANNALNPYNVEGVNNYWGWGLNSTSGTLSEDNYKPDGVFAEFGEGTACHEIGYTQLTTTEATTLGLEIGTVMPWGQKNTLAIIKHRNRILQDGNVNMPIPQATEGGSSELEDLKTQMEYIATHDSEGNAITTNGNRREFYFPAASACYAYEPMIGSGDQLDEKFKAHNWFYPAMGDMVRLCWYNKFEDLFKLPKANSAFAAFGASYSSSTESAHDKCVWEVGMRNGTIVNNNVFKSTNYAVRPVAAF